ncbi:MAG: hypothetical protein GY724_17220 [Actinomycetia bacterium]|nr:hypothetical protein [Actinomycetes bacterium]MCP4224627.1 hypothetical protein [Actinomycetes bacterium]MCP5034675.1 hypothetical protein [Actinomycetes bacterium]
MLYETSIREPRRPGWYPVGDGRYQRYYAGQTRGWTNAYIVDIESRDPRHPPPVTKPPDRIILLLLATCFIVIILLAVI